MPDWVINRALESYRSLRQHIEQLTEDQVATCLQLERQTRRRKSVIKALTGRAVSLNRKQFTSSLKGH